MTHNSEFHSRTKHIDVKFHYIRQLIFEGTLIIDWIPTDIQLADGFTKVLTKEAHWKFVNAIGLTNGWSTNTEQVD